MYNNRAPARTDDCAAGAKKPYKNHITASDVVESFRNAAAAYGRLIIPDNPVIGKLSACGTEDKPRSKNGRYVLFIDGQPAGGYENMADGQGWQKWRFSGSKLISTRHSAEYRLQIERERLRRAELAESRYNEAATKAALIWNEGTPATDDYPYLKRKGVISHGLRICESGQYAGWLIRSSMWKMAVNY